MPNNEKPEGYKFKVDKEKFESDEKCITGLEILQKAGVDDVSKFGLYQKLKGKPMERIEDLTAAIDLSKKGIERFVTLPLEQQEGEAPQRVSCLPDYDEDFLNSLGLGWEVKADGGVHWLVIHHYPIPDGYNVATSTLSLRLERSYPDTQIDMVYFANSLALTNNCQIGQLASARHLGQVWQRWSRHRTTQNPWRVGIDCVETHIAQVQHWLERELG